MHLSWVSELSQHGEQVGAWQGIACRATKADIGLILEIWRLKSSLTPPETLLGRYDAQGCPVIL